jgi:hypothetical protein
MWREKLKEYIKEKLPFSSDKWNSYLKIANEHLETYKDISAVLKFLGGFNYPDLTKIHFYNFLELLEVPEEERKQIVLDILSERLGVPVTEDDVRKAAELEETLPEFLERKKDEVRGKIYKTGYGEIIRRKVTQVKKPERLIELLGREVVPYIVKGYLSEEYLNLFKGGGR